MDDAAKAVMPAANGALFAFGIRSVKCAAGAIGSWYHSSRLQASLNPVSTRRKVLIAAPFPPRRDGLHGGSQTIGRLTGELAEHHAVVVLYLRAPDEPPMGEALVRCCEMVEEVPRTGAAGYAGRYLRLLGAWARGYPVWVEDWRVPSFERRLRDLVASWRPDIVHFEFHTMAQYAGAAQGTPTVLVQHEPGEAAAHDRWQFSQGWRRVVLGRDRRAWEVYERDCLAKIDAVVCFTERDRRELLRLAPAARIEVIAPPGPALAATRRGDAESTATILFVGNYVHPPNVDAAIRLAGTIFPRVRMRHPGAMLQLVGDAPPAALRRLAVAGIVVTGRVPDVVPYLEKATVVVAPLRTGGGLRAKVMDALAMGKAMVVSPLAAEGLNVAGGQEVLLAESDEEFADAVCALLSDARLRKRLAENALAWIAQFGATGRAAAAFERLYESLNQHGCPCSHPPGRFSEPTVETTRSGSPERQATSAPGNRCGQREPGCID